jgi:hypothetical protein
MRGKILSEIQRLAKDNGGQPPGARIFEQQTGIRTAAWRGKYWARWSDAVAEAGLAPNQAIAKIDEDHLLAKLAEACRALEKIPTYSELRIYRRSHSGFPHRAIVDRFGSTANRLRRLSEWVNANGQYADVAALLTARIPTVEDESKPGSEGVVYLIRWGTNYKIGRGNQLERASEASANGPP